MKSKVFILAHKLRSKFNSWSECLKFAWAKIKLVANLRKGVYSFSFIKKSTGEVREAKGTLNQSLINYEYKGGSWSKWNIVRFFDTKINEFRCLDVRTLIKNA
jgi:hypothetical protein